MNKYNTEDYFSVIDKNTGKKLLDCGEEQDAIAMVAFDPVNRSYMRNKFLMGQVIDIEMPKALPTTNIAVSNVQENECVSLYKQLEDNGELKLPESKLEKFVV